MVEKKAKRKKRRKEEESDVVVEEEVYTAPEDDEGDDDENDDDNDEGDDDDDGGESETDKKKEVVPETKRKRGRPKGSGKKGIKKVKAAEPVIGVGAEPKAKRGRKPKVAIASLSKNGLTDKISDLITKELDKSLKGNEKKLSRAFNYLLKAVKLLDELQK